MISTKTKLLAHQKQAYDKLIKLKVGALYMDMGTGKTRTTIELIKDRFNKGKINHILWFCPCSIKTNLEIDIEKHSEGLLENITIIGLESISLSSKIYKQCLDLVRIKNCYLIVDESNLVKNPSAVRTKRIISLAEVCKYKLILNGTPITKTQADLYAQWYILDKRIFGYRTYWSFAKNHLEFDEYGNIFRVLNVDYLTNKIAPYSFEIKKTDCLTLPQKNGSNYHFSFTEEQSEHYQEILTELTEYVDIARFEEHNAAVYRLLTALQLISSGRRITSTFPVEHENFFKDIEENPRLNMLNYLLNRIDDKVIIWCRYHFEIEQIKQLLEKKSIKFVEFHGKVDKKERNKNLKLFEKNKEIKVFLGNKVTGGYGLNLQVCSNMIFYSLDFDWGANIQASDRIYRIGQTKECNYYNIISRSGIDSMILSCLNRKANLEDEIRKLLKKKNFMEVLSDKNRIRSKTERKVG